MKIREWPVLKPYNVPTTEITLIADLSHYTISSISTIWCEQYHIQNHNFVLCCFCILLFCTNSTNQEKSLRWHHNGHDCVSNHQPRHCLPNRLFERRSKKTSKLRATGLCVGNSPGTDEFPAQMASNAENVSIWWCHHVFGWYYNIFRLSIWNKIGDIQHWKECCNIMQHLSAILSNII